MSLKNKINLAFCKLFIRFTAPLNSIFVFKDLFYRSEKRYRTENPEYKEKLTWKKYREDIKIIAFYLPQFHQIDVNDKAWGQGFTDWENVSKALPLFRGHYQPRIPADLGYYDLLSEDVHRRQVEMASEFGLYGFCYHTYWFDPTVIMDKIILRHTEKFDFPFMLCWANEAWSKRWDGSENEVIVSQEYQEGWEIRAAQYFSRFLSCKNYIKIDDRPVFIIYRSDTIPDLMNSIPKLEAEFEKNLGISPILVLAETFKSPSSTSVGLRYSVQFPPHRVGENRGVHWWKFTRPFSGKVASFDYMISKCVQRLKKDEGKFCFPTICPGWDNIARKPFNGVVYANDSPEKFLRWGMSAIRHLEQNFSDDSRFLFINAWNEWAEGAHLEPDRVRGFSYLNAVAELIGIEKNDR